MTALPLVWCRVAVWSSVIHGDEGRDSGGSLNASCSYSSCSYYSAQDEGVVAFTEPPDMQRTQDLMQEHEHSTRDPKAARSRSPRGPPAARPITDPFDDPFPEWVALEQH